MSAYTIAGATIALLLLLFHADERGLREAKKIAREDDKHSGRIEIFWR